MILNVELSNKHMREVRDLTLSVSSLEEAIKAFPYDGESRIKDQTVENSQLPPIALVFYDFLYNNDLPPSPETLIREYLNQSYFSFVSPSQVRVSYGSETRVMSREGLEARILRTYPSLLRDLHFYLMSYESGLFEGVWYSLDDDFKKGIDIKVRYNGKWFNVALLQNTRRSIFFRNRKKTRHNGSNADVIYVELDPQDSKKCGDYYLFTKAHVKMVYNCISR